MGTIIKSNIASSNIHLPKENELPLSFEFIEEGDIVIQMNIQLTSGQAIVRTTNEGDGIMILGTLIADGMSFAAPSDNYSVNKLIQFMGVKKGEKRTIFLNCLDRLEKLTIKSNAQTPQKNCKFNIPIIQYLATAPNLISLGFDQSAYTETDVFDLYNLILLEKLEELSYFSFGMYLTAPNYLFSNPYMKKIRLSGISNVNCTHLYENSPLLENIEIDSMYAAIDNDISVLVKTNCKNLTISSQSTLANTAYWGGGRNLVFTNNLKSVVLNGLASNKDYADIICVLSNSNFDEGATVTTGIEAK